MMKKNTLLAAAGVVAVVALLFPLANLVVPPHPVALGGNGHGGSPQYERAIAVLGAKCGSCHAAGASLPFYASFPVAKGMIEKDVANGLAFFDLKAVFAGTPSRPPGEVSLAKLEYVVERDTMPPGNYRLLHWNGALTGSEREAVITWIRATRADSYASPRAKGDLRSHVLQPLPTPPRLDAAKVALGKALYHDPRLSKDDTISCASCHDLKKGGTDRQRYSTGVGGKKGGINAPTVFNAALQIAQFWDGRAVDLQAQADGPPNNPIEMASSWPEIIGKLKRDKTFERRFLAVYPDGFSGKNITGAIATYEKTLLTPGDALDRYLLGDERAFDAQTKDGYELFLSTGCATCHVGMALGGRSYERIGRYADYVADRGNPTDADLGRYNVTRREGDRYKLKVPLLRNVALTPPYFHDGTVDSLEKAVVLMAKYQLDKSLTSTQVEQIVVFLRSLVPETLPAK